MGIKAGDTISINHYSKTQNFKGVVVEIENNSLMLKLTKELRELGLCQGDPLVIGYAVNDEINTCESDILEINSKDEVIKLKVDNTQTVTDKRLFERFPVSLSADLKIEKSKKRVNALIKNINNNGMSVFSKTELGKGDEIYVDLYVDKRIISLKAEVIWLMQVPYGFEYGLKTVFFDFNARNSLKLYLELFKNEQVEAVKDLKN